MKYQLLLLLYTSFSLIILANGKIDPSFKASDGRVLTKFGNFGDNARKVLVQPDGKIVVIGKGTAISTFGDFSIARFNYDGSGDLTFGNNGKVSTTFGIQDSLSRAAVFQTDGKIVVVGQARANNTSGDDFGIIRYNSNGTVDNSFGNSGKVFTSFTDTSSDYANDVAIKSDGKILVSGNSSAGGFALAQYNINGSLDTAFGIGGKVIISIGNTGNNNSAIAVQEDGKIILAGSITNSVGIPPETQYQIGLARLNSNGSLDSSFDTDGKVSTSFGSYVICNDIQLDLMGKSLRLEVLR